MYELLQSHRQSLYIIHTHTQRNKKETEGMDR